MSDVRYESNQQTVQDILNRYQTGSLNLEPGFQRKSVWNESDRKRLIDSIVRGYPLPAIFLYHRKEDGEYDVIDGKQRILAILAFVGELRGQRFAAKLQLPGETEPSLRRFKDLERLHQAHLVNGYKLQVVEVGGELASIIDLFVRINSTGKALTSQEKRNAKYSKSPFLQTASRLAKALGEPLTQNGVMSAAQIDRMKDVEIICELMLSVSKQDVINKKAALDHVMGSAPLPDRQLQAARDRVNAAIRRVFRIFPELESTRFTKISDFYSLVFLFDRLDQGGAVLNDRNRNALAQRLLIEFSRGVDQVRETHRKFLPFAEAKSDYKEYYDTVREGTDAYDNRKKRHEILCNLFSGLFEMKDARRIFSATQRRILWNSTQSRKCRECGEELSWTNFTIDHRKPWSKGGATDLRNAALCCHGCNASKGNRKKSQRARGRAA